MSEIPQAIRTNMKSHGIDVELTSRILDNYNAGAYDHIEPVRVADIPRIDGEHVVDMTGDVTLRIHEESAEARVGTLLGPDHAAADFGRRDGDELIFSRPELEALGTRLLPRVAYGVLNGGSATSYADYKKNAKLDAQLLGLLGEEFERLAHMSRGRAKGITPAFLQPDGTPGPGFLELKMRSLLILALKYQLSADGNAAGLPAPAAPLFQMTSVYNTEEIARTYDEYRESPLLADLIDATGIDITRAETGVQPLLAAYTHSDEGRPKRVFTRAYGTEGETLPVPGGHGQNFQVLRDIYHRLYEGGKRFAYIGNVDNLGFTVDPVSVAYLALSGKEAAFDFSFRTSVDVKGGILVVDQNGRMNAADLGVAVGNDEVAEAERRGKRILFNCATGLFNLEYLVAAVDDIIERLPVRFSDQDKDAGKYSQAEQVTWEIIGMLDDFVVFGVDKYERFLAAKILLETLMTSGVKLDDDAYPTDDDPAADLRGTARKLHAGLEHRLGTVYGMKRNGDRWVPKPADELRREML
ncbi:MAG: UTP--glucose-1-phosphate uridylyltransferase [Spirochaetaceae bacterium]